MPSALFSCLDWTIFTPLKNFPEPPYRTEPTLPVTFMLPPSYPLPWLCLSLKVPSLVQDTAALYTCTAKQGMAVGSSTA